MSRKDKMVRRLLSRPRDFTYEELVKLLNQFGYEEVKKGKTSGSRRAFIKHTTMHMIRLHKPHPGNLLKTYQVVYIIDELKKSGMI